MIFLENKPEEIRRDPNNRIYITGAAGSGTTTLAQTLSQELGCQAFDADDYFWEPTAPPYQTVRAKEDRLKLLAESGVPQSLPGFVLSGSICGWGQSLEDCFDLIVFLYVPTPIRLERLRQREIARHGRVNPEFLEWAGQYDDGGLDMRSRAQHEAWLSERTCEVLRLEGDLSVQERVKAVLQTAR